ncbi:hypothetical protein [Reichenbachiella sp.]|uniref:hypothetical protein n=1 Tax=Reichenbachiella sp. TaxID=2184521 RepID=UPI003298074B
MMRVFIFLALMFIGFTSYGQKEERLTTIGFVQILNDNKEEATYYYQNNWLVLRKMAIEKGYIHSYQILEVPKDEGEPFDLMLITTFSNEEQYAQREANFNELIEEKGPVKLMNDKQPAEFRKTLFNKRRIRQWK